MQWSIKEAILRKGRNYCKQVQHFTDMLRITTITLLLAIYIQYVEGIEKVIVVSEPDNTDALINDDKDTPATSTTSKGSGSHDLKDSMMLCCIYGNCSCPSLFTALTNLVASSTLINVTTDVVLSSIIPLANFANITISGHNNPTVNCSNSGGLHFISCHNCTIRRDYLGQMW